MGIIKKASLVLALLFILAAALYRYSGAIAMRILGDAYGLDISYKACSNKAWGEFSLKELSVVSRKAGLGLASGAAVIKPLFANGSFAASFDLTNVTFIKKWDSAPGGYDTLALLASSPFNSKCRYGSVRGRAEQTKDGIRISGLEAVSDDIRLSLNGILLRDGKIDSDIVIYFAEALTDKVPPEVASALLANTGPGWKKLSVRLSGDPEKPSIQVSSKLFRLSIKAVSGT